MGYGSPSGPWAAKKDWIAHRNTIKKLYVDEERSLKEVKAFMERKHGFLATDKMYKTRLRAWNMEKNLRRDEVLAMMRVKLQRDAAGERAEFWRNGKIVSYEMLQNYLRFNRSVSVELQRHFTGDRASMDPVETLLPPHIIVLSPMAPLVFDKQMHRAEGILVGFKNYIKASLSEGKWRRESSGNWHSNKGGNLHETLRFRAHLDVAINMVNEGHKYRAIFLNRAFAAIKPVIETENPSLVIEITVLIHELEGEYKRPEIGRVFIDYVTQISRQCLGSRHPVTNWFMGLQHLKDDKIATYELLIRSYEKLIREREQRHTSNVTYAMILYRKVAELVDPDFAEKEMEKLNADIEELGRDPVDNTYVMCGLWRYRVLRLTECGKLHQAGGLIQMVRNLDPLEEHMVHEWLAAIYGAQGRLNECEREFALEIGLPNGFDSEVDLEDYDIAKIRLYYKTVRGLENWGLFSAAEKLRSRRDRILDETMGDLHEEYLDEVVDVQY